MKKCILCNRKFKSLRGLITHIVRGEDISLFEYYLLNHKTPKCNNCNRELTQREFISYKKGYVNFCLDREDCIKKRRELANIKGISAKIKQKIPKKKFIDFVKTKNLFQFYEKNRKKKESNDPIEYEKIIIPYFLDGIKHNYIVDFKIGNTLIEIKPEVHLKRPREQAKIKAAKKWCNKNNFIFSLIGFNEIEKMKKELINQGVFNKRMELI